MSGNDEDLEAVHREIMRRAESELGRPLLPPPTPVERDPDFNEVGEGLAQWWRAHSEIAPALILRCGIDGCRNKVGEVKFDGVTAIALMYSRFGVRTVPYDLPATEESLGFPPGTELKDSSGKTLVEIAQQKRAEFDAETLYYVDNARRVAKHYTANPTLTPLEVIGHIVCPDHGIVALPNADAVIAEMRDFLAGAEAKRPRRQYVIFRGK